VEGGGGNIKGRKGLLRRRSRKRGEKKTLRKKRGVENLDPGAMWKKRNRNTRRVFSLLKERRGKKGKEKSGTVGREGKRGGEGKIAKTTRFRLVSAGEGCRLR